MAYNPNNPNGQATGANSAPVVLASDKALPAGTNTIGNVGSSSATGSAVPANAHYVAGINTSGNLSGLATVDRPSDAASGSGILAIGNYVYNGTNFDRARSAAGAPTGTAATALLPATSGGTSIYSGSLTTTVTDIKASAGQLYGWQIGNTNATNVYVQIFNLGHASVTLGTTPPTMSLFIPTGGGATINLPQGIAFGTAISVACTTTRTGSTAPASSVDLNFFYA